MFEKFFGRVMLFTATLFVCVVSVYATLRIIEAIWWQLILCTAAVGFVISIVLFFWARFRRW